MKKYEKPEMTCRRFKAELRMDVSTTAESRAKADMLADLKAQTGDDSISQYIVREW